MSFTTSFKTIIEACPSIGTYITGGIKFGHLPEDFDIKKNWLCWDFNLDEQVNVLNGNDAYSNYTVAITLTSNDSVTTENIGDILVNYLNNKSTSDFPDIYVKSDSKTITLNKPANTYQTQFNVGVIYIGN